MFSLEKNVRCQAALILLHKRFVTDQDVLLAGGGGLIIKAGPHQCYAAMRGHCFALRKSKQVRCNIALGVATK